ncbi:MAG TPA: Gfo/Idh/MocA family oxidoreductase [Isosphaeraceae bacterium]|jgi:predicted dehydrogenase|nr:Gfo/Idh/MocA family oxidoreductase [Isosphaeraceae bacterium]
MSLNHQPLGILVVGAGFLGSHRAAAASSARGTRLVAVCDRDPAAAQTVGRRFGVVTETSFERALNLPGIEAVIVATPHADHAEQVRLALEAGKHVLCEKPLTVTTAKARSICHLARECGQRLATGFNHRFYAPVQDALWLVAQGRIGRVESVRAQIGHRASETFLKSWHADPDRSGGGTLLDNGPHACDLARRLVGEVVAVQGYVRHNERGSRNVELEAFALFRNRDCAIVELRSSWALERGYLTLEVRGATGHLHVETAPWRLSGTLADGHRVDRHYTVERLKERLFRRRFGCERSLLLELESFASAAEAFPLLHATGWDGCRATEMVQGVYESARSGREVVLEPLPVKTPSGRRKDFAKDRS